MDARDKSGGLLQLDHKERAAKRSGKKRDPCPDRKDIHLKDSQQRI